MDLIKGSTMDFDQFQNNSRKTWVCIDRLTDEIHIVAGLAEETGELLGKIKRLHRDILPTCKNAEEMRAARRAQRKAIMLECGDVLYMLARVADANEFTLMEAAKENIAKITDRQNRGVINGSGDDR